jgi:hypothetical protein
MQDVKVQILAQSVSLGLRIGAWCSLYDCCGYHSGLKLHGASTIHHPLSLSLQIGWLFSGNCWTQWSMLFHSNVLILSCIIEKVIHRQFFLTENSLIFLVFAFMENNAREWLIDCWKTSGHM